MGEKIFTLLLLYCLHFNSIRRGYSEEAPKEVSILIMGQSGAGIFSTAEKLVNGEIQKTSNTIPHVTEYSWEVPVNSDDGNSYQGRIRIAVSPGLVNGKTVDQDAQTLATVKNYIQSPSGLNHRYPSIVIIVSRFDDGRARGDSSIFVRMLKDVELLKDYLGPANLPSNKIFHFTYLMSRTRTEARKPDPILEQFKSIIADHTEFPEPIRATVGENLPDEYGLKYDGKYIKLPNKELYPLNIINEMIRVATDRHDISARDILKAAYMNSTERTTIATNAFTSNESGGCGDNISDAMKRNHLQIKISEITDALKEVYDRLDENSKCSQSSTLYQLQLRFQQLNITTRKQLPTSTPKIAELFQKLPLDTASTSLIVEALHLKEPEFMHPPIVGYGYDILKDETISDRSPFIVDRFQTTPMGYSFPDILYGQMEPESVFENFELFENNDMYMESRLKDLNIEDNINSSVFSGQVRSSYNNLHPDSDVFVTLTAIQQIRYFKLSLIESPELDDEFMSVVNTLLPFNSSDPESPIEWTSFFGTYGTHIVTEAYGGGYMEGKAIGESIKNHLNNPNLLESIKANSLVAFSQLPVEVANEDITMSYTFYGGSPDRKLAEAHTLPSTDRDSLSKKWKDSVRSDPRVLEMNLKLIRISSIAQLVNPNIGREVERALNHLLKGTLKYKRNRVPKTTTTSATFSSPTQSTTESSFYDSPELATTHPPECPLVDCPTHTCSPCNICHSVQAPASASCPTTKEKYSKNILGQSYHILKDDVLPNSPFQITMVKGDWLKMKIPNGFVVKKIVPCAFYTFEKVKSRKEYVALRINKIENFLNIRESNLAEEEEFQTRPIRPGYTISDKKSAIDISYFQEARYFKIETPGLLNITSDFTTEVTNLPMYNTAAEKCTWFKFFDKYGTHVVMGGYAGIYTLGSLYGLTPENRKTILNVLTSTYCIDIQRVNLQDSDFAHIGSESLTLISLDKLNATLTLHSHLETYYEKAVSDLVKGKLNSC